MRLLAIVIASIFLLGFLLFFSIQKDSKPANNTVTDEERTANPTIQEDDKNSTVILTGLEIPWEIAFDQIGNLFISERPGRILLLKKGDSKALELVKIPDVYHIGEGGLLGLALHPDFAKNNFLYTYYTYKNKGQTLNKVVRFTKKEDLFTDQRTIIDGIPGSSNHNGGRIKFGPDGYLYITTGDAQDASSAQDRSSLAGKILRIRDDGSIPDDNPFSNKVYSYGHRNPQGLAWDSEGRLWSTEHGRSGVQSGLDELNLIEKGRNYGWPKIQGDETQEGLESPKTHSGPKTTWAPSGTLFFKDSILFAGLRGQALYRAEITKDLPEVRTFFQGSFGRLRTIALGQDGLLYVATNNRDGRGTPRDGDDKIIRINPADIK